MFYRGICRAYRKHDSAAFSECDPQLFRDIAARYSLQAFSVFCHGDIVAVYYESSEGEQDIEKMLAPVAPMLLDIVQGSGKKWGRMWELFHYSGYADAEQWQRKVEKKKGIMLMNRLKPEMFSSYVFHHYQLQEEEPGSGDRYGLISFYDGLMCFYMEEPTETDKPPRKGKLDTKNSPLEQWHEIMGQHFIPWEDYDKPWKPMEPVFVHIGGVCENPI